MTTTIAGPAADIFATNETRIEGRDKVSGRMKYTADVHRPGELWAAFAITPVAHARVLRVDTSKAKEVPGVRAVLTAADIGPRRLGRNLYDWPVLCYDRVRFIGDRVAAVAAETREAAERAAALIEVEYEELPAVFEAADALAADAPVLHPDRGEYLFRAFAGKEAPKHAHPNIQGKNKMRKGAEDLEPLFASAYRVFEHTIVTPRQHAGYIEPRSTVVWIDGDATVHVATPNKQPYTVRDQLAHIAELPKEKIVVEPTAIGGDFGGKGLTVDEFPCYFLAKATGRPVRFVEQYSDELRAGTTRHRATITLRSAVDAQGKFVAHASKLVLAGGAYAAGKPGPQLMPGNGYATVPYQIPNVAVDVVAVYTNTLPTAHVRAPGGPQIAFAWEQHVDQIAAALGIDPLEFRLRNCVRDGDAFPTKEKIKSPYASKVLETLQAEAKERPLAPGRGRGRGHALVAWHLGGGKTAVKLRLHPDGRVEAIVGVPDQGAGAYTMIQRVAAAALGLGLDRIAVRRGTTSEAPQDPGAGASRVTHVVGRATEVAAGLLCAAVAQKTGAAFADGRWTKDGAPAALADLAGAACDLGPLDVVGEFDGVHGADHAGDFTFTGFTIDVDVDAETGQVRIADVLIVADVGRIINPIAHQGQVDGGFIYGLGTAVMEEMPLDESGKVTTLSLGEYKLPTIADIPPLRTILIQAPMGEGPYGAKMAGELSNTGVPAAVMNAVANATGVRLCEYPITSERIFAALTARTAAA